MDYKARFCDHKRLSAVRNKLSAISCRQYLHLDVHFFVSFPLCHNHSFAILSHPAMTQGIIAKNPINASSPAFETSETITIPSAVTR